jgi:hypothetical protein
MNGFSRLNAEQHIMGPDIILIQVMTVIGRNQRNRKPLTHIKQNLIDMVLNVYQGGEVVKSIIGAKPKAALLADLAPYL